MKLPITDELRKATEAFNESQLRWLRAVDESESEDGAVPKMERTMFLYAAQELGHLIWRMIKEADARIGDSR